MKQVSTLLLGASLWSPFSPAFAADNSGIAQISSIESRESGYHALYLSGAIPSQGCSLVDRAIIVETSGSGKSLLGIALSAMLSNRQVILRVDGCVGIDPSSTLTAARILKVQIY